MPTRARILNFGKCAVIWGRGLFLLPPLVLVLLGGCVTVPLRGSPPGGEGFFLVSSGQKSEALPQIQNAASTEVEPWLVQSALHAADVADSTPVKAGAGQDPGGITVYGLTNHDVVDKIVEIRFPQDVVEWWAEGPAQHREDWAHTLSEWESKYLAAFSSSDVPQGLRLKPLIDAESLTHEEAAEAAELFGLGVEAVRKYANYANRRRIIRHYIITHPATVRLSTALYGLFRDMNPLHFALERGWQIGSGKEMFTEEDRSRLGAAGEFLVALAIIKGVEVGLNASRPSTTPISTATELISGKVVRVDPRTLRWSQSTAGGRGRAEALRASMREQGWAGEPIDVVVTKDGLVTVDHTRAAVALELQLKEVPVRLHLPTDALPAEMLSRPWNSAGQTATTWGEAIALRGAGQIPPIGPTGTSTPPRLPKPPSPKGK